MTITGNVEVALNQLNAETTLGGTPETRYKEALPGVSLLFRWLADERD